MIKKLIIQLDGEKTEVKLAIEDYFSFKNIAEKLGVSITEAMAHMLFDVRDVYEDKINELEPIKTKELTIYGSRIGDQ